MTIVLPFLSPVAFPLVPVAVTWLSFRRGYAWSSFLVLVVGVVVFSLFDLFFAIFFLLLLAIPGLAWKAMGQKGLKAALAFFIVWLFLFMFLTAFNVALFYQTKTDFIKAQKQVANQFIAEQKKTLEASGNPAKTYEPQLEMMEETLAIIPYLFPSALALLALWITAINFLVTSALLRKAGFSFLSLPPIQDWRFPWYLAWGYLLGLIGILVSRFIKTNSFVVSVCAANLLIFFGVLFMLQGLAVVTFFLNRFQLKKANRFIWLLLVLTAHLLFQVLTWLGLFDTWLNFRKLSPAGT